MIALDVMGGDHAPQALLRGALSAAKSKIPVKLFGPEAIIIAELNALDTLWQQYSLTIVDSLSHIEMDEEPVTAIRQKRDSSLVKAVNSVRDGHCSAVISAGNSGALMVASTLILGRLSGVERPAIAGFLPAINGPVVALDLGANTECRAHHLVQFAQMGADYAIKALCIDKPRIGLLANGHEDRKGSVLTKEAFALLKETSLNFVGNVEPYDVFTNKVDVVVCDGFSGNILLKTMEAIFELFAGSLKAEKYNKDQPGGALLLGVQGCTIVCHGNSDADDIHRAIKLAHAQHKAAREMQSSPLNPISHQTPA